MANLTENTTSLREVLEILQTKASGGVEPTFQDKTVTPSTEEQTVTADDGYDGLRTVIVEGDSNLASDNIISGVTIFGVEGTVKPTLYGTYTFSDSPNYLAPNKSIELIFDEFEVYTNFYNGSNWEYLKVYKIVCNDGTVFIYENEDGNYMQDYHVASGWKPYYDDYYEFPDERYRIMDFREPVEVPQEFYNAFISLCDNTEITPYEIGQNIGHDEGFNDATKVWVPLIIQGEAESITNTNYDGSGTKYNVSNWVDATACGVTYNWTDDLAVSVSGGNLDPEGIYPYNVQIVNNNPRLYVEVCVNVRFGTPKLGTNNYIRMVAPPDSTTEKYIYSSTSQPASCTVQYLQWSDTEIE